jgi:hypothetical protein
MRAVLFFFGSVSLLGLSLALAVAACDDTPRGEQGIDYLSDGSYYTVPPARDAGADVLVPCVEEKDTTGVCAEATAENGTPATHFIVCVEGRSPVEIVCVAPVGASDAALGDAGMFCCTTGVL